jgi:trk system potassium uptake protein TrkH
VLLSLSCLIIIGGLGFVVWKDIWNNKFRIKRYTLHSKIVLISTFALIVFGALLFYSFESNNQNTLLPMTVENKIVNSVFQSITTRTAGFFSIEPNVMTEESNFLTIILMLIGAAPGSTGGGIKVTTISILILASIFFIMGKENVQVIKNSIPRQIIFKSICIFMLAILLVVIGTFILLVDTPNIDFMDALYEVSSALSTCGLSTGITSELNIISKITLMLFMFVGRLGPLTLVIAFSHKQTLENSSFRYSDGKISVG